MAICLKSKNFRIKMALLNYKKMYLPNDTYAMMVVKRVIARIKLATQENFLVKGGPIALHWAYSLALMPFNKNKQMLKIIIITYAHTKLYFTYF